MHFYHCDKVNLKVSLFGTDSGGVGRPNSGCIPGTLRSNRCTSRSVFRYLREPRRWRRCPQTATIICQIEVFDGAPPNLKRSQKLTFLAEYLSRLPHRCRRSCLPIHCITLFIVRECRILFFLTLYMHFRFRLADFRFMRLWSVINLTLLRLHLCITLCLCFVGSI